MDCWNLDCCSRRTPLLPRLEADAVARSSRGNSRKVGRSWKRGGGRERRFTSAAEEKAPKGVGSSRRKRVQTPDAESGVSPLRSYPPPPPPHC